MLQYDNTWWAQKSEEFRSSQPFNHIVIDDFLEPDIANKVLSEFPNYDDSVWSAHWKNAIEDKKGLNHWDRFGTTTYQVFSYLMSNLWIDCLKDLTGIQNIYGDIGLHGGGLHAHEKGGNLNIHLDYSIHPKLGLLRKFNIILYVTPDWDPAWGGGLQLWSHDWVNNKPKECVKEIENKFNRAVIFDTTQNSWHGLPQNLICPKGIIRRSLAAYYLTDANVNSDPRGKALFAPRKDQENDESVIDLIEKRSSVQHANQVWRK